VPTDPRNVLLLVLDVDGVMTDGSIWIGQDGYEMKRFHVRDGLGVKMWQRLGYKIAVVSGRTSQAVTRRMEELGISLIYQSVKDKKTALSDIMERTGVRLDQIAYCGDDWPDVSVMKRVGYPIAVADAEPPVKALAVFVTKRPGGQGAVREVIDHLLMAKGKTDLDAVDAELNAHAEKSAKAKKPAGTSIFGEDDDGPLPL
jgi:3-deoxy-D-manno-octulosonate 8-phosphate phosphatase (KDO 8-P phosphatase)